MALRMPKEADDKRARSGPFHAATRGLRCSLCGQCGQMGPWLADGLAAADGKLDEGSDVELRRN